MAIVWETTTHDNFNKIINGIPAVLREFAKDKVSKRAEKIVLESNRSEVTEKDMIDAFFKETPSGFWSPLMVDMDALGLDYKKYGYK